jgi:hypothetical protein
VSTEGGFVQDMALGQDGKIYMVGNFSGTQGGIDSPYIIRYNGSQFEAVGLPGRYATFANDATRIAVDDSGSIHILISFSYTDIIPLAKDYLVLNGNTWSSGGLYSDPVGYRIVADGVLYWDEYKRKMWIASRPADGKITFGGGETLVENNGESVYPKLVFTGGGKLISLYNRATNKIIEFSSYTMQDNEIVTLDLSSHGYEIMKLISNVNGNITSMISPSSNLSFNLVKESNKIGYVLYEESNEATCFAEWREKYIGVYEAMNFRTIIS